MKKLSIMLVIFLILNIFSVNAINEYILELVATKNIGNGEGELGWDQEFVEHMGSLGPQFFTISKNNLIYVCDQLNGRLTVYDISFNHIKSISAEYGISSAKKLYIDEKENIISLALQTGLVKVNNKGGLIFQIEYRDIPRHVMGKMEFFVFDDDVIYFDNDENLIIIDGEGKSRKETDFPKVLEKYNKRSSDLNNEFLSSFKEGALEKIEKFVKDKKLLKVNGIIYTAYFDKFKEYGKEVNELKKNRVVDNYSDIFTKIKESSLDLIGYDNDGNSYWEAKTEKEYKLKGPIQRAVIVCSKYGEILDCFYNLGNYYPMAVAPNGDVYFRESVPTDGKYHFYKVTRRW